MKQSKKILIAIALLLLVTLSIAYFFRENLIAYFFRPTSTSVRQGLTLRNVESKLKDLINKDEIATLPDQEPLWGNLNSDESLADVQAPPQVQTLVKNLNIPWEIVFLADESILVTERPGDLVRIYPNDRQRITINGVSHRGEGGLLGMALHPNFAKNNWLYLYLTSTEGDKLKNRVERYTFNLENNTLSERTVILDNIGGAPNHDGGRIAFGPDGLLYVTTGDAQNSANAQNTSSLEGKILRIHDDGTIPTDNPFGNAVYSYGHRNPQGIAWDNQNRLWSSEHGPSGAQTGNDEINLIEPGINYGWPTIKGDQTASNMRTPIIQSGSSETWAPADIAIYGNQVLFTGLRGESLYVGDLAYDGSKITNLIAHFRGDFGRIRAVVIGPDNWIYITTSNTDGRGRASEGDDKIIRINPSVL